MILTRRRGKSNIWPIMKKGKEFIQVSYPNQTFDVEVIKQPNSDIEPLIKSGILSALLERSYPLDEAGGNLLNKEDERMISGIARFAVEKRKKIYVSELEDEILGPIRIYRIFEQ